MQDGGQSCLITPVSTAYHNGMTWHEMGGVQISQILSGLFSYSSLLPLILISPAVYLSLHSWAFSQVNQNFKFQENILRWKMSLWLLTLNIFTVHSSWKNFCFVLRSTLKSDVMTGNGKHYCRAYAWKMKYSMPVTPVAHLVYYKKNPLGNTSIRFFFFWFMNQPARL